MRKLVAVLSLSTSVLAVISIYLGAELNEARGEVQRLSQLAATSTAQPAKPTHENEMAAGVVAAVSPIGERTPDRGTPDDEYRDAARRKLAQLSDHGMRAQMLEEWIEANLPNKAKYARYLDIDDTDAGRLLDLLGEQFLAQSEAFSRCTLQPRCDYQSLSRETNEARHAAIEGLLGTEKAQRFEQYMYTDLERGLVSRFLRDRIPTGSEMSEAVSERLVATLADERKRLETQVKQRGLEPFSYPMEGIAFTFESNPFQPGSAVDRLKEAADYNRLMHARAKETLSPEQLAAFEQMQEAAIVGLKFWLRQQERDHMTRTNTGERN